MLDEKKIANAIDSGYIRKCAEYGLNYNNQNDRATILALMNKTYKDLQLGN
jgi:hypothetical protein